MCLVINIAMTVGDLAIEKGIPFLAKNVMRLKLCETAICKTKPSIIHLTKPALLFKKLLVRCLIKFSKISTKVRPNRWYKTDRPDLDGSGIDIHSAIGKIPKPKRGWTLPSNDFTGSYNPLEQQLKDEPETGKLLEIYQLPAGPIDVIAMQHGVDYGSCSYREQKYGEDEKI